MKTYQGYKKTKHIDVCHHFIKKKAETVEFKSVYILSKNNVADLLTKALPHNTTWSFALNLGLWGEKTTKIIIKIDFQQLLHLEKY